MTSLKIKTRLFLGNWGVSEKGGRVSAEVPLSQTMAGKEIKKKRKEGNHPVAAAVFFKAASRQAAPC